MNPQSKDDASQYYSSSAPPNMPLKMQQQQYSGNDITSFHPVVYHASMPLLRNNDIDQRLRLLNFNPVAPVSTALYPVMLSGRPTNDNSAYQAIGVAPNQHYYQPNYQVTLPLSRESVINRTAIGVGTETHQESLNAGPGQGSVSYPQVSEVTLGDSTGCLSMVNSETHHNVKATDNECKTLTRENKRCPFPQILYQMLMKADAMNFSDIISFLPHGRAFIFFELYAFIILTSTLVLGINYFVIITRPLHPIPVRKRSSSSSYMIETYNTHHRFSCY